VLIQTEVGKAATVATKVAEIPGVARAEDVTGPTTSSCRLKPTQSTTWQDRRQRVQLIEGITRTLTCRWSTSDQLVVDPVPVCAGARSTAARKIEARAYSPPGKVSPRPRSLGRDRRVPPQRPSGLLPVGHVSGPLELPASSGHR